MRRNHILILCAALIAILPLLTHGPSCGHDFDFHLQSWLDAAEQLRHGTLLPHWAFSAAYNAGEPRFLFYPPLSWMLGAVLTLIFPIALATTIYTFIALLAAGLAMHRLARHFAAPNAALLAATLYIVNPYMLFNAFERTAYGELLAAAWLPLLFLAILRERPTIRGIALPVALLWLTNAPAAVMGCYTLALVIIARLVIGFIAIKNFSDPTKAGAPCPDFRTWVSTQPTKLAMTSIVGTAFGLSLPAFYLIPAAYERRFVQITMAIIPNMRFQDNFLFAHTGDAPHDRVLHTASLLAVALLVLTAAALLTLFLLNSKNLSSRPQRDSHTPTMSFRLQRDSHTPTLSSRPQRAARSGETAAFRTTLPLLAVITLSIAFLLLPLSSPLWNHLPELAFLQFPWRLLSILAVVLGLALAMLLDSSRIRNPLTIFLAAASVVALTFLGIHTFRQSCDDEDLPTPRAQLFNAHQGVGPTDEYTPINADNDVLRADDPPFWLSTNAAAFAPHTTPNPATPAVPLDAPQAAETAQSRTNPPTFAPENFTISAPEPEFLILNLRLYPDWRILVNDREPTYNIDATRDDGLTAVAVPAGISTIQIEWRRTLDQQLGLVISAIASGVYAGLIFKGSRFRRRQRAIP